MKRLWFPDGACRVRPQTGRARAGKSQETGSNQLELMRDGQDRMNECREYLTEMAE